jgi:hypothetical protein
VYLDRECLQDGIDWELNFIQGLVSSMVMLCILSFNEDDRVTGRFDNFAVGRG